MYKNYLTIAIRNLRRHTIYSFINIFGLAVGMACCILILLFVQDELSYDQFHQKADQIHRVHLGKRYPIIPIPVSTHLRTHFPEVDDVVNLRKGTLLLRQEKDFVIEKRLIYTEPSFFNVFTTSFILGDPQTALQAPNSIVLTQKTAHRYFGSLSPLGKTLEMDNGTFLTVTGVVQDFPEQSHFHFDFIRPITNHSRYASNREEWGTIATYTYFTLQKGAQPSVFENKLKKHLIQNVPRQWGKNGPPYRIFPMKNIHLHSHLELELEPNGEITNIYIFASIAILILVLACINFVNLATARASKRSREVGIRKVLGSYRRQLMRQFLLESCLYVSLAVILAFGISELGLPLLNTLAGKNLTMASLFTPTSIIGLMGIIFSVAFLSGLYPAFFLSSFLPVQVLKGQSIAGSKRHTLRNGLVVTQFAISICLLIGMFIVREQLHFAQNVKLGFNKEHVLVIHGTSALEKQATTFRDHLTTLPQVSKASLTQTLPGRFFDTTMFTPEQPAHFKSQSITYATFDEHSIDVLGLNIVQGRNFEPGETNGYLINESATQLIGWDNPIGKTFNRRGRESSKIIGVVQDFHFESFRHEVKPLIIPYLWWPAFTIVRLHPGHIKPAIENIQATWKDFAPQRPFEYSFLDEDFAKLYQTEMRISRVFEVFSALAIFIACLGLFGLAAFTAEQRTKEIGIRKVLGASVPNIVLMLSKDFIRLVFIAFIIATPLSYYAMDLWLQDFAYRTPIHWLTFALSGALACITALLTVSYQAAKAAQTNPINALRNE